MSRLAIFALGPLRVELGGQPLQTSRHKALALLVYLAMSPGKQSREALSALLWPDYGQEKAFAYLRRTLWELHNLLGEGWLEADREMIGFCKDDSVLFDVVEFQFILEAIDRHHHSSSEICQECVANLHTAALLYRGDFLAGFSVRDSDNYDNWQLFKRQALRQQYAGALQKLANSLFREGSCPETIAFTQRWLALDMLNEEAHRLLMKTYALNGQRYLAVKQYHDCVQILHAELGIAPEPETARLYDLIISGAFHMGEEISRPQTSDLSQNKPETGLDIRRVGELAEFNDSVPISHLSLPSTLFFGRQSELNIIGHFLSDPDCWILTLLGPGGIGKTRLAVETGRRQADNFPQGVFLISLGVIESERSIAPAITRSLGFSFRQNGPTPEEQLFDFLREKQLLLILDSFEQLVQWANLLEKIHFHAPGIKMLVTSRHRLLLKEEKVVEVKGLDYPPEPIEKTSAAQYEMLQKFSAVDLFLHAARRARESFQPSPDDRLAILKIAQIMEGLPLGLELAATWVNTLSCREIANEICRGLDILESTVEDISERQRSMKAVFRHSWNLLSSRERMILPRLAVFRGSFSRQAAEQVSGTSVRELFGLVNKSLIRSSENGRFDLHDLLRQYLLEILDSLRTDGQETRCRHCTFFSARIFEWNEKLRSVNQGQALGEIEMDLENCKAAWEWAVNQKQFDSLEQMIDGLGMFYLRTARLQEGWETYWKANAAIQNTARIKKDTQCVRLSARLLTWQAVLSMNLEHFDEANLLLQEALRLLDHQQLVPQQVVPERIYVLVTQALLANLQHDPSGSLNSYRQAIELSRAANAKSPAFFVFSWRFLMGGSVSQELYLEIEKNLDYVKQSGDPFELACHLFVLGIAELYHAYRMEKAEPLLTESIKNFELVDDPSTRVMIFKTLGYLLLAQGKFEDCYMLKQREMAVVQDIGDLRMIGITHAEIGEILCHLGKYSEAEDEIRKGMALVKDRSEVEHALRQRYLGDALLAQGKYQESREVYEFSYRFFQSVGEKGWMFTALTGLSRVEFARGDRSNAWLYARQALRLYGEIRFYTFFVYLTLAGIALLLVDSGKILEGLELFNLASQQGYLAQSLWFADLYGRFFEQASTRLSADERMAANEHGFGSDLSKIVEAVCQSDL